MEAAAHRERDVLREIFGEVKELGENIETYKAHSSSDDKILREIFGELGELGEIIDSYRTYVRSQTVLVVDDDLAFRVLFTEAAKQVDPAACVVAVPTIREALQEIRAHTFGAALLDVNMPGEDTLKLAKRISRETRIIFVSAAISEKAASWIANQVQAEAREKPRGLGLAQLGEMYRYALR